MPWEGRDSARVFLSPRFTLQAPYVSGKNSNVSTKLFCFNHKRVFFHF